MDNHEAIISGIRTQHEMLRSLIDQLGQSTDWTIYDHLLYSERTKSVSKTLRKLRKSQPTIFSIQSGGSYADL